MSSSPPTSSSAPTQASPSPSNASADKTFGIKNSSNLYLITFLATLFLLLFISCTIVLRSFIIRRRFQRQIDDAIAAGIILAPRAQGSHKRRFGHKPKMYTSWVAQGGEKWSDMMPISALPVQAKRRSKYHNSASSKHYNDNQPLATSTSPEPFARRLLQNINRHDHITTEQPSAQPVHHHPEKPPKARVNMLQVSVLIAMPSPTPNKSLDDASSFDEKSEDEAKIPEVVFGVTRLPYDHSHQLPVRPAPV